MTRWLWVPFLLVGVLAIVAPFAMYSHGLKDAAVSALGVWVGTFAVLMVGMFAIPQLALAKASVESDIFLKACAIIDDEKKFGPNLSIVTENDNATLLQLATLSDDGRLRGMGTVQNERLANAVLDVLYTMEQVGILFHYSTNKAMIEEYAGDVVIISYEALANVIKNCQKDDLQMYERFEEMYKYCKPRWSPKALAKFKYTNIGFLLGLVVAAVPLHTVAQSATFWAQGVAAGNGASNSMAIVPADATPQCHSAREASDAAKAASKAADEEKALTLDQEAIELFEACRKGESPGSATELNDAASELDAELDAAAYFWKHYDDDRAQTLMGSARVLLMELCFRKSRPDWPDWTSTLVGALWFNRYAPEIGVEKFGACPSVHLPAPTPTP